MKKYCRVTMLFALAVLAVSLCAQPASQYRFERRFGLQGFDYCELCDYTSWIDDFAMVTKDQIAFWSKADGAIVWLTLTSGAERRVVLETDRMFSGGNEIQLSTGLVALRNYHSPFVFVDGDDEHTTAIHMPDHGLTYGRRDFAHVVIDNILVYEDTRRQVIHTFQIIETEAGLDYIYRDPEQTRAYIEERYEGRDEFWFDGEFLMYGERLVTGNPKTFHAYFRLASGYDDAGGITRTSDTSLLGVDREGNYYWVNPLFLAVYTPTGRLLKSIRFDMVPNMGRPQIDPDGNIYILSYGGITPGRLDLLWIERDW